MNPGPLKSARLTRRAFLRQLGVAAAALAAAGCRPGRGAAWEPAPRPSPSLDQAAAQPSPSKTSLPNHPPAASPSPITSTPAYRSLAATARVPGYSPQALRAALEEMLAASGALAGRVRPGCRVGIKVNLTGGTWWDGPSKPAAIEYFATHPAVVGALAEILLDLGAGRLVVMDGLGDETSFDAWGYRAMAAPLGIELIDLCKPHPHAGFARYPVGSAAQVYDRFSCHGILGELDLLVSAAKMKPHSVAGVTLSMKNLFGLAPISEYRRDPGHNNRSWFHESTAYDPRLAGIILDLNRAFPIGLALIDGIYTAEGGAGPWDADLAQVKPGVLALSRDPVAADSVAAALMGFDPAAAYPAAPFLHCENHLALAAEARLGTNRLEEIGLAGPSIAELALPFRPAG